MATTANPTGQTPAVETVIEKNIAGMIHSLTNRGSTTLIERQGNDLIIKLANGDEVIVERFFIAFTEAQFHEMQAGTYGETYTPPQTVVENAAVTDDVEPATQTADAGLGGGMGGGGMGSGAAVGAGVLGLAALAGAGGGGGGGGGGGAPIAPVVEEDVVQMAAAEPVAPAANAADIAVDLEDAKPEEADQAAEPGEATEDAAADPASAKNAEAEPDAGTELLSDVIVDDLNGADEGVAVEQLLLALDAGGADEAMGNFSVLGEIDLGAQDFGYDAALPAFEPLSDFMG